MLELLLTHSFLINPVKYFIPSLQIYIDSQSIDYVIKQFNPGKILHISEFELNSSEFIDGISENPEVGDTEIWRIINPGIGVHPIHVHQIQFQILDRTPFDTEIYNLTGRLRFTGEPEPPAANERGWKDTVHALPGYITRIIMRFGPYTGRYVFHCHILEHEDHDMMRPFDVIPKKCKD